LLRRDLQTALMLSTLQDSAASRNYINGSVSFTYLLDISRGGV